MAQNLTNANYLLKTVYAPAIRNAVNNGAAMWANLDKKAQDVDWEGEKFTWTIRTSRSSATRAVAEGGKLPPADRQRGSKAEQDTFEVVHTIKLSKKVMRASRSARGSLMRALADENQGAERDLTNDVNRQAWGRGTVQTGTETVYRTGCLGFVAGAPAANVITLDDGAGTALSKGEMRFFFVGMLVTAIDPTDGTVEEAAMEITAVDVAASTITVDDDGATADNDILVRGDSTGTAYDNEFPGLRLLINDNDGDKIDGTNTVLIHNISSATQPVWQSQVLTGPIGDKILQDSWTSIVTDGNGEPGADNRSLVFCSHEQLDAFANKLIAARRYDGREMTLATGWRGLTLSHGSAVPDRYCPTNLAVRLNLDDIAVGTNYPFEWDDEDGEVLFKTSDELQYEARFSGDVSPLVFNRNSHSRMNLDALP